MSRIGKKPVPIGAAKVSLANGVAKFEGPKGKLELAIHPAVKVALDAGKKELVVTRPNDERLSRALHGTFRALLQNCVVGVTEGFKKSLDIQGVGYKAEIKGKKLSLALGYANIIEVDIPAGVEVKVDQGTKVHVSGPDKQMVGQFASQVRHIRSPEPYKGKGIRYEGEYIKIKPGKAFAGAGAATK